MSEVVREVMTKPRIQIIRGLPGAGKSTLAMSRYPNLMRIETDMFFYRNGEYKFTLENNKKAVKWFKEQILICSKQGMDFVLTGVFSAHTERLGNAVSIALDNGYEVYIKTLTKNYGSIHGVPQNHLDAMKSSFVPDRVLKEMYVNSPDVHFGLMPKLYTLAHLKKGEA